MAYQLIYTSSPKGLAMGRSGFCTVARSADMPQQLATVIEPLGVYERPQTGGNPVSYTLSNIIFGRTKYYILTRAQDCGVDYTNRNNYIAHHIVVPEQEIGPHSANPAEIMLGWKGWRSSWDEEPRLLDEQISMGEIPRIKGILPAKTWEGIFGDAGKAALLTCGQKRVLHASPGKEEELLRLYAESLELELDTQKRWNATFTTCVSGGVSSRADWAAYCTPRPDADIDLDTASAPEAPGGRAAQYARSGELTNRERFNLTVKGPQLGRKNFDVVEGNDRDKGGNQKLAYLSAVIAAAVIVAAFGLWAFWGGSKAGEGDVSGGSLKTLEKTDSGESFSDLKKRISESIEKDDFSGALSIWKNSLSAQIDPSFGRRITRQICERFDDLVSDAELLLLRGDISGAESKLGTARSALAAAEPPDAKQRSDRLAELKEKIDAKKRK